VVARGLRVAVNLYALVAVGALSGCFGATYHFQGMTVVAPDGSVWRSSRHHDCESTPTVPGYCEEQRSYETTKRYAPGAKIPPDYVRESRTTTGRAANQINVAVRDYFFVKWFDFTATYQDTSTDRERARMVLATYFHAILEDLANGLSARLAGVTPSDARNVVRDVVEPIFRLSIEGFLEWDFIVVDFFDHDWIIDELVAQLPPPSPEQAKSWRDAVADALNKAEIQTDRNYFDDEKEREEAVFGAQSSIFDTHLLKETVYLPGDIVRTNAALKDHGWLSWEFNGRCFTYDELILRAHSRVYYPKRVAWSTIAVLTVLLVTLIMRRRYKSTVSTKA